MHLEVRQCSRTLVCDYDKTARYVAYIVVLEFVSPAAMRMAAKREKGGKYNTRKEAEAETQKRREMRKGEEDELAVSKVFA